METKEGLDRYTCWINRAEDHEFDGDKDVGRQRLHFKCCTINAQFWVKWPVYYVECKKKVKM